MRGLESENGAHARKDPVMLARFVVRLPVMCLVSRCTEICWNTPTYLELALHFKEVLVQPALGFGFALPSSCPLAGVTLTALGGAVPIANALVTLAQQCIAGNFVLVHVSLDVGEGPGEERVELKETGGVDL